ncbi:hypothetical protein EJD97_018336, partial [Solanum chilense]
AQSVVDQQAGGSGFPEPTSSAIWTPSVVSSATTALSVVPLSISTGQELDSPAANSDALIWCASSSASEALIAASISWCSFFRARASSSTRPLRLLACSRGGGGGISEVVNGPLALCPQQARQKGPQTLAS